MKRHFLIPFLGVAFAGGIGLFFVVQSDNDKQQDESVRKIEPPLYHDSGATMKNSFVPPAFEANESRSEPITVSALGSAPQVAYISSEANQGVVARQTSLIYEIARDMGTPAALPAQAFANGTSPKPSDTAILNGEGQTPSTAQTAETEGELPQSGNPPNPEPTPATSGTRTRRSPFTIEEEWYRYWHGWGSIDSFRAAQPTPAGH